MPADPAVSIPGSGPDEAIAPVRSPGRRRRFALRRPAGDRNYPTGPLDVSDRDCFKPLREPGPDVFIGGLQSRFDNKPFFAVARRRVGPAGEFAGVTVVAVSPDFFRTFYAKLLPDP